MSLASVITLFDGNEMDKMAFENAVISFIFIQNYIYACYNLCDLIVKNTLQVQARCIMIHRQDRNELTLFRFK